MNGIEDSTDRHRKVYACFLMACTVFLLLAVRDVSAQQTITSAGSVEEKIRSLTDAMSRVEAQMQESQQELAELKKQLASLRTSSGLEGNPAEPATESASAADLSAAVAELRETQGVQEEQISTLDQSKVESVSKYPLKLSGMILLNGFVNTREVDAAAAPTVALYGSGSTGASLRQTVVGIDVSGPRVLGATTQGDLRLDMNASASGSGYSGSYALGLVRLRTAHLDMNWNHAQAFFSLDRSLLSSETPSSLTAVAVPPLAWSGNLWAWNPQAGISYDVAAGSAGSLKIQAALMDVADPPRLYPTPPSGAYTPPSTAELSRWPGVEARVAFDGHVDDNALRMGLSGYFAPHRISGSTFEFDSWASAADFHVPVFHFSQISASAYFGTALGGLGGGAYKDIVATVSGSEIYYRALDDRGGWAQWKQNAGERLEFNEAFGIDNVPAGQLRPYATATPVGEYNLARNRTFTGNVIYSPSAYLLFSLEYRHIMSAYVTAPTMSSDVIGLGAGYKF
jgi:hypothetical protein